MYKRRKVLWFDCETTGLDPQKNCVLQFAAIITENGVVIDNREFKFAPQDNCKIDTSALKVNGKSEVEIKSYPDPDYSLKELAEFLKCHNKNGRLIPAGYNVRFDIDFMVNMFNRSQISDKWFFYVESKCSVDVLGLVKFLMWRGDIDPDDGKLETLSNYFGLSKRGFHDARVDVATTFELFLKIEPYLTPSSKHFINSGEPDLLNDIICPWEDYTQ